MDAQWADEDNIYVYHITNCTYCSFCILLHFFHSPVHRRQVTNDKIDVLATFDYISGDRECGFNASINGQAKINSIGVSPPDGSLEYL